MQRLYMAGQIPCVPLVEISTETQIGTNLSVGDTRIASAQPLQGNGIGQTITLLIVALSTGEDEVPGLIFQNE